MRRPKEPQRSTSERRTRHPLGNGRVQSSRPLGLADSTQQGRYCAAMRAVSTITVATVCPRVATSRGSIKTIKCQCDPRRYLFETSGGSRGGVNGMHPPCRHAAIFCREKYPRSLTIMFGRLLQPEAILDSECIKKHLATGLHLGPHSELTALPQTP